MKTEERRSFINALLDRYEGCDVKLHIGRRTNEDIEWLLNVNNLKNGIHADVPTILHFYDGSGPYDSPTEVTVFMDDEDEDYLRKHPKLKAAYEEHDSNKKMEGGE